MKTRHNLPDNSQNCNWEKVGYNHRKYDLK